MITGSCLCGTVRYEVEGLERMSHCHCSMCRKAHGAPFATYATVPAARFRFVAGEEAVERYESSPGFARGFCRQCGSVVPDGAGGEVYVPAGCLDDDPGIRASAHIFVASKAPWHPITDDLPRHDGYSSSTASVERPAPGPAPAGVVRGSCLCGDVAFEVRGAFDAVRNCHCSRCRKARAAAYTTNGFTPLGAVRFVRGGEKVRTYRRPDARYFAQAFCPRCGSGMPRLDPERGLAVIPLGALDDDPGGGAQMHIYVADRAPWFALTDDLPRYEQRPE
jgi:hypothetical protein